MKFTLKSFFKSWKYAFNGIRYCFGAEENLTIMVISSIVVIFGGFFFNISHSEWLICIILIMAILALELFNTGIEHFLDLFHPELNDNVKHIKDLIAGGVAIASLGAITIGFMIFLPKILKLFLK